MEQVCHLPPLPAVGKTVRGFNNIYVNQSSAKSSWSEHYITGKKKEKKSVKILFESKIGYEKFVWWWKESLCIENLIIFGFEWIQKLH